jgi:hypothetical protein
MKRSSRPRKTTNLSGSAHQQLNMYALAASAAGVSVLALANTAQAKIVYTPSHVVLGVPFKLDLNGDGITDFYLTQSHYQNTFSYHRDRVSPLRRNEVFGNVATSGASALPAGVQIGHSVLFSPGRRLMDQVKVARDSQYVIEGPWANHGKGFKNRYLGLKFFLAGKVHFGWARLTVKFNHQFAPTATLTGYAYETIPGKAIKAGQTKGRVDDPTNENFGPGASLTNPIPDTPEAASLGALAMGAPGLSIWRRKDNLSTGTFMECV